MIGRGSDVKQSRSYRLLAISVWTCLDFFPVTLQAHQAKQRSKFNLNWVFGPGLCSCWTRWPGGLPLKIPLLLLWNRTKRTAVPLSRNCPDGQWESTRESSVWQICAVQSLCLRFESTWLWILELLVNKEDELCLCENRACCGMKTGSLSGQRNLDSNPGSRSTTWGHWRK